MGRVNSSGGCVNVGGSEEEVCRHIRLTACALPVWQSIAGNIAKKVFNPDNGGYTQIHADAARLSELSGVVTGCPLIVLNTLGAGFPEKVYDHASAHEVREAGLLVAQQNGSGSPMMVLSWVNTPLICLSSRHPWSS